MSTDLPIPTYLQTLIDRRAADEAARDAHWGAIAAANAPFAQYGTHDQRMLGYETAERAFWSSFSVMTGGDGRYNQRALERLGNALVEFEAWHDEKAGPSVLANKDPHNNYLDLSRQPYGPASHTTEEQAAFDELLDAAREAVEVGS